MTGSHDDFPFTIRDIVELLHLRVRRPQADTDYTDCPFCGDQRGKMNVNYAKNVWRCNYCGEGGGMLALYGKVYGLSKSDAYREICESLQSGLPSPEYGRPAPEPRMPDALPQSERAGPQEIHQTYALLLKMLSLTEGHRRHLRSPKRGLADGQIEELGLKSTPPPCLCRSLTRRLQARGCTVRGVPGFYLDGRGDWTVKFGQRTSGILLPAVGIDGLIKGIQILLDTPIRDKDDPPDKSGTKYIWLSSAGRNMGTTSGSPAHFIGDPFARTVYVTEGILKADIAHFLAGRSFVAIAGANNVSPLGPLMALLAQNGTELIVEAHDMDKFQNSMVQKGASKLYLMAKSHGMDCRRLTWNPNHKGVDDWLLALRTKEKQEKEQKRMNFKQQFLHGLCGMEAIDGYVRAWHDGPEEGMGLTDYLGLTEPEYQLYMTEDYATLEIILLSQRKKQRFRIYQLDLCDGREPLPFAFQGTDALYHAGYRQPPAAEYRLVCDGTLYAPRTLPDSYLLELVYARYNDSLPAGYAGRSVSPSDVLELYDDAKRRYFYREPAGFTAVGFSPFLCKRKP